MQKYGRGAGKTVCKKREGRHTVLRTRKETTAHSRVGGGSSQQRKTSLDKKVTIGGGDRKKT